MSPAFTNQSCFNCSYGRLACPLPGSNLNNELFARVVFQEFRVIFIKLELSWLKLNKATKPPTRQAKVFTLWCFDIRVSKSPASDLLCAFILDHAEACSLATLVQNNYQTFFPITFPYAHHALDCPASLSAILEIIPCLWGDSPEIGLLVSLVGCLVNKHSPCCKPWCFSILTCCMCTNESGFCHSRLVVQEQTRRWVCKNNETPWCAGVDHLGLSMATFCVSLEPSRMIFGLSDLSSFSGCLKVETDTLVRLCGQRWGNVCRCGGPPFSPI